MSKNKKGSTSKKANKKSDTKEKVTKVNNNKKNEIKNKKKDNLKKEVKLEEEIILDSEENEEEIVFEEEYDNEEVETDEEEGNHGEDKEENEEFENKETSEDETSILDDDDEIDEEENEDDEIEDDNYDEDDDEEKYDEDDDDFVIVEEEEKKVITSNNRKKNNKKEKSYDEDEIIIKKIEKKAKENKKIKKTENETLTKIVDFVNNNIFTIYGFIAGVLLTTLIVVIIWPSRIATLKDGTQPVAKVNGKNYTADRLYEDMKSHYSVSQLLDEIDTDILSKKYKEDKEMKEEVKNNAEKYLNMYKQYYGYTEEQFLTENGFASYDAFLEYLRLEYRRNKYLDDYVEKNIKDSEIDKYYNDNVFGDINCQHILVEVKDENSEDNENKKLSDEDAKKLVQEIIDKLNDGTTWEDIQKEYKDKVTYEDLGYQAWDANLEKEFMNALKKLEDNSYSTEPVKTSYGYHVIYRLDQKEKPSLKKAKKDIIEKIVDTKKSEDSNLLYKALINLRKENKLEFKDTDLKSKYDAYIKKYK